MNDSRSILSRFSGLLLFILTLVVVGVLVVLTINAARNDSISDEDQANSSDTPRPDDSSKAFNIDGEAKTNETPEETKTDGQVATNDEENNSTTDNNSDVAGSTDNNETAEPDQVAVTGPSADDTTPAAEVLPNTGPSPALIVVMALGATFLSAYIVTRRDLVSSLKK